MISCISYKCTCRLGHEQGTHLPRSPGSAGLAVVVVVVVFWLGLLGLVPPVPIPACLLDLGCWWLLVVPLVAVIWDVFSCNALPRKLD